MSKSSVVYYSLQGHTHKAADMVLTQYLAQRLEITGVSGFPKP